MIVNAYPAKRTQPVFNGNLLSNLGKKIVKLIEPKELITKENQAHITQMELLARNLYDKSNGLPISMSVKNGNKEFSVIYNTSVFHRMKLTKKNEVSSDFEIMHVKLDNDFAFYSTGNYPCRIIDERFVNKYNELLAEWLPRLNKKYQKLTNT